jgi:hypothetical protein
MASNTSTNVLSEKLNAVTEIIQQSASIYTVKPPFIVFIGSLKKKRGIRENNDAGAIVEIGFAQGP